MKVVEIFESIDGEGIRVGFPVTFIRLFGCNLRCSYCDSRYACEGTGYTEWSIEGILKQVESYGHKRVTLTGGEPLIHKDVNVLINSLIKSGYEVNIETDGAVNISNLKISDNIIITLDYKCPSSLMEDKMVLSNFDYLRPKDVLKFVVGNKDDLLKAEYIINKYDLQRKCNIYFSPVFDKIESVQIVEFILKHHLEDVRIQLQLHKFIWEPNKRGV